MRTVVLDTNVLLDEPGAILAYPDAQVIVPETVLGEIDKLKVSRVDPDLRFRGREISRMLFELSETGDLMAGVDLPDGGTLRVASLDSEMVLPEGLSGRNPDDRILATALSACQEGCTNLTLVTNDLNMLLKAQTFGLKVERRADLSTGIGKRTVRWFQRYKTPITILAVALAVFAGVVLLAWYTSNLSDNKAATSGVPAEFRDILSSQMRTLLDGLTLLEKNPNDKAALKEVGNSYYALWADTSNSAFADSGITYYTRYLEQVPGDPDVRTDMAVLYYYIGQTDRAIQEVTTVLDGNGQHVKANFNLGIFYWQGRSDYQAAANQFATVIDLTRNSTDAQEQQIATTSRNNIQQIKADAAAAGATVTIDPTYLPEGTI